MPILSVFSALLCVCGMMIIHHVEYQGFEALVEIRTGEVLEGRLPRRATLIVREWCLAHQFELLANWERAQRFELLERIQGADYDD